MYWKRVNKDRMGEGEEVRTGKGRIEVAKS